MPDINMRAPTRPLILVVEDEPLMREAIASALIQQEFEVAVAGDGAEFEKAFSRQRPALVLVDWGLPDVEGTSIVERVSHMPDIGVVMLTGRGTLEHRLQGMEQGADAYLVKPVDWRELTLTLRAILKRLAAYTSQPAGGTVQVPRFSPRHFELTAPNGERIQLNAQECILVEWLLRRPGEVVPKEALMEALGAHGDAWGEPRLAQTVSRLRRKLEGNCPGWAPLNTVHRVGYRLDLG